MKKSIFNVWLSLLLIISGVFFLGVMIFYRIESYGLIFPFIIGPPIYLIIKDREINSLKKYPRKQKLFLLFLTLLGIFGLLIGYLLSISFLALGLILIFIFLAISSQIIFLKLTKKMQIVLIIKIIALAIFLRYFITHMHPSLLGIDPYRHLEYSRQVYGNFVLTNTYNGLPIFHISSVQISILLESTLKNSFFLLGILPFFSLIFIYIICRKLFNAKIALLSFLLICFIDSFIHFSIWIIPMFFGLVFFVSLAYFHLLKEKTPKNLLMMALLFFALLLTHTIIIFLYLIFISSLFILDTRLINWSWIGRKFKNDFGICYISFITITSISYWRYLVPWGGADFFTVRTIEFARNIIYMGVEETGNGAEEIGETWLEHLSIFFGYLVLLTLAVIASLILIKNRKKIKQQILIVLTSIYFLGTYGFALFGMEALLSYRWRPVMYLFMIPLSAYGIYYIFKIGKNKRRKFMVVLLITFFFIFPTIFSPRTNPRPIYNQERSPRIWTQTESELQAVEYIGQFEENDSTIFGPFDYRKAFIFKNMSLNNYHYLYFNMSEDEERIKRANESYILIRQMNYKMGASFDTDGTPGYSHVEKIPTYYEEYINNNNKIYSSGGAYVYKSK